MLAGKKILLGITGSIAAYKAIMIVRLIVKAGAEVKVIMTPAAKDFVSALTLSTLSNNKVLINLADEDTWANHVMLGRWADVMLIAPLSCNTLAKMSTGMCDNLVLAAYLSATCPVVVAPAMDEDMWKHTSIQNNIRKLELAGNTVIKVGKGALASGLYGEGRMAEPEEIITLIEELFFRLTTFKGRKAMVTAGPTYEQIDPVRFVGNHSSGKMGYAIAEELYMRGAEVTLVSGPTSLTPKFSGINVKKVQSAAEMYTACISIFPEMDIAVMAAAVADYTIADISTEKIKKNENFLDIHLTKTKDILKNLGELKNDRQFLVGFALETTNEKENALQKLKSKNADLIVLNSLKDVEAGFGKVTNKVTIFDKDENEFSYEAKSKLLVAKDIVELIHKKYSW
ncbi:MAG: bifunctional phosphopantothenoylcysteine decarboxylase/phosphopantothenate--cysteine ligase CoaBC [Chitinophagaceae bacterium]|nr:bifunctional phosphopantothenoylcysteine decarboxylase/phosphopantothenate--cysteine ligase CoaBC [Chitinophagaceae bacterium]